LTILQAEEIYLVVKYKTKDPSFRSLMIKNIEENLDIDYFFNFCYRKWRIV